MQSPISDVLGKLGAPGSFSTRRTLQHGTLGLEVRGVGKIHFPVSAKQARALCAVGRHARFGFRDQTLLDRRVRDTWEVAKSRIKFNREWPKALDSQLDRIGRDLGVPEGSRLEAQLHNMVIYEPGQFFVAHQDSEKGDGMIGSLTVLLPSRFKGGAMVVRHHEEAVSYRGSEKNVSLIAFYADCHHEVRPLTAGYRVALTYNLILDRPSESAPTAVGSRHLDELTRVVRDHFETRSPDRWRTESTREPPDRLVYLLDHQYTQRGLDWAHLKNGDRIRAAALREVAKKLDCEVFLALADVHETWSCEDDYLYERYGRRRGWRREDMDLLRDEREDYELIDLMDWDIELRHWVGSGRPESISDGVGEDEVCWTKPSVELEPFESEHEGYMGNWGNTVDRWYHRAAVVLWPKERTFLIRAKASAAWAIGEVSKTARSDGAANARAMAESLLPFWTMTARAESKRGFFEKTLQTVERLEDPELGRALLEPFSFKGLTAKAAPHCVALLARYGLDWVREVFAAWRPSYPAWAPPDWLAVLPDFAIPLCLDGGPDGTTLIADLISDQWEDVRERRSAILDRQRPSRVVGALDDLNRAVLSLLEATVYAQRNEQRSKMLQDLGSSEVPPVHVAHLLRDAYKVYTEDVVDQLDLHRLHGACVQSLQQHLDVPSRESGDWSIQTPVNCNCQLCKKLTRFLRARDETKLEWPLAKDGRRHIHNVIDGRDLPVKHETTRSGRPYTLVLTKTKALFDRERAERTSLERELRWLRSNDTFFGAKKMGRRPGERNAV